MLRKNNKGHKVPPLQGLSLAIRPIQTDRADAFLFADPWLPEALVGICTNALTEKSDNRLRVHFFECGSGGLLYSFMLEIAARGLLDSVTVSAGESDTKQRDLLEAAIVSKQELACVHDERMLPYFDIEGDELSIGQSIRREIAFSDGKLSNIGSDVDVLIVGKKAKEQVVKTALAHFSGDENDGVRKPKFLALSKHPQLNLAEEIEANGWYEHPLYCAELGVAASVRLSIDPNDQGKSASNSADKHNNAEGSASNLGRLFFKGSLQAGDSENGEAIPPSTFSAPVDAGVLLNRNAELENTVRRTLGKKRRDIGLPLRIVVTGKTLDIALFQTLAAAIGAGSAENRIEVALDNFPDDPELFNGNVREKYVAALPRATREKLFGPWFVAGRYAFKPSIAKALHWRLNSQAELELDSDPQWHHLIACSVSTQVYAALSPELKELFNRKADSRRRHRFSIENAIARHGIAQTVQNDEVVQQPKAAYRVPADDVALLPPAVLATLFKLVPGSGLFEALQMPSKPVVAPAPQPPEQDDPEATAQTTEDSSDDKDDKDDKADIDASDPNSAPTTLPIDAILVVPIQTKDPVAQTQQLLEHHIMEMGADGLIAVPRSTGDELINWLRKYGAKPARLRNAQEIHDGFVGARALGRARINSAWAYPSFAELLEEDQRSTDEYNWLFTKGDAPHLRNLGPVVLDLRSVSLDFNNKSVLLDPTSMFRRRRPEKVTRALDSIDLQVRRGEVLGVVGRNGSGKSTLMRLLVGAYLPDEGERWVDGETRLVTVGTGLNPDQTGYANLMMMGQLIGMSKAEIEEKLDDIAEFTELGSALDRVVRHYSSGMRSRLSFAIATAKQSDILILDEVFATGDRFFVDKSKARIRGLIDGAKAVIIVSHQVGLLRQLATRVIWIEKGKIIMDGDPDDVVSAYLDGA